MFKINVSHKGKTYKAETENESLVGTKIGDKIKGEEISADLAGYEVEITGTSDKAGFPGFKHLQGPTLRKILTTYGPGMHKNPKKEGKKPSIQPNGLRLRKTFRGNEISIDTVQINTKVVKEGKKKFDDLFKAAETEAPTENTKTATEKPTKKPVEAPKKEF